MDLILTKQEQLIYDNAGGGECGKKAVLARREYIKQHNEFLSHELKEWAKLRYLPNNEKDYIEPATIEDYYD